MTTMTTDANQQAIERVLACEPRLVGVKPAGEVVPGLEPHMILHAAPATTWDDMAPILREGVTGASLFQGLAQTPDEVGDKVRSGEIVVGAAQDHAAMAGGPGTITHSLPVMVVEDRHTGNRASHFLMEGFGKALILGVYDDEVLDRLHWFRDELGPALDTAIDAVGGIDVAEIIAESLRRGDELHNRNAAATSMLAEQLAVGFARAGVSLETQERAFALMRENSQFFAPVSLAVSLLALQLGSGVENSSLVVACGANGRDCGIKVAGLADRWFTAPAEPPVGVLLEGFTAEDVGEPCGDSLLVECYGLGASVLPASPGLWSLVGADAGRAHAIYEDTLKITLGEHPSFRVPVLGDRGAPVGIDAAKVVETGIRPVIDIVMVHPEPGRGVIGFGLCSPPMRCFEQAVEALG